MNQKPARMTLVDCTILGEGFVLWCNGQRKAQGFLTREECVSWAEQFCSLNHYELIWMAT